MKQTTFAVRAPAGIVSTETYCPETGAILRIDEHGIIAGLDSQQQVDALVACGYVQVKGAERMLARLLLVPYAEAFRANHAAAETLRTAVQSAVDAGEPLQELTTMLSEEATRLGVPLPSLRWIQPSQEAEHPAAAKKPEAKKPGPKPGQKKLAEEAPAAPPPAPTPVAKAKTIPLADLPPAAGSAIPPAARPEK